MARRYHLARRLLWILPVFVLIAACSKDGPGFFASDTAKSPLADTLVTIFRDLQTAALSERPDQLVKFLDSAEARRLTFACHVYGVSALGQYLSTRFGGWPNLDTLFLTDLTVVPPFARIALCGKAARIGVPQERIRFTFLLFRRVKSNWRLASVSILEKNRYDRYGTELSYLETELPPDLRFPRLF